MIDKNYSAAPTRQSSTRCAAEKEELRCSNLEPLMSALPPKADMDHHGRDVCFVPKADIRSALFDHLVGEGQEILGQLNACALCRLEIDH
jgi:hypothetical protein